MNYNTITADSLEMLYKKVISRIMHEGEQVTARGLDFKECRYQHLVLTNPRNRIIENPERNLNKRFAMGEFIWIMSGNCMLDSIVPYNKRMGDFSDDGITLHGAYGPRLRRWGQPAKEVDQLDSCLQRLKNDIYTRQASIVILDPAKDFTVKTKDVPCNNYLQFLYREGKLDLNVYVRSNDIFLGFPYDIFEWTMLQEIFAKALKVELGEYHHMVGSLHIYNSNFEKMSKIEQTCGPTKPMVPMPDDTNLYTIKCLDLSEEIYRTGKTITGEIPAQLNSWWQDKFDWIKK
jgi:thymidylate synthase